MTELSITREKASAIPPRIIVFTVPPISASTTNAASADKGMERSTADVARKLPRNMRIIKLVRINPRAPSCSTVRIASFTYTDWSKTMLVVICFGMSYRCLMSWRTPSTTAMVLVSPPCFMMGM